MSEDQNGNENNKRDEMIMLFPPDSDNMHYTSKQLNCLGIIGISLVNDKLFLNNYIFANHVIGDMKLVKCEDSLYRYKDGFYTEITISELENECISIIEEAAKGIWDVKWQSKYIKSIKGLTPIENKLNPYNEMVNFKNGMLNINSMEFLDHNEKFLSTVRVPYDYDSKEKCPKFRDFLVDIFEEDLERVTLIQEVLGYCLSSESRIQKGFVFLGLGSNGKSVLLDVIRNLVGMGNVANVALKDLEKPFALSGLVDKLINVSPENEFGRKFNTQNFKAVTSGEVVNVDRKHKSPFSARIYCTLIIALNSLMDSDDISDGYYRRLQIIPFNKTYKELRANEVPVDGVSYMDKSIKDRLLTELPGIFNYALEGLKRLKVNDFNLSNCQISESILKSYRDNQNPIDDFIRVKISKNNDLQIKKSDFFKCFKKWITDNGTENVKSITPQKFWGYFEKALREQGFPWEQKRLNGYDHIVGLELGD